MLPSVLGARDLQYSLGRNPGELHGKPCQEGVIRVWWAKGIRLDQEFSVRDS